MLNKPQVSYSVKYFVCFTSNFVYILRLLAGKFVPVCTEFPLATFPAKNFNKASYKNSRQNIIKQHPVQKELKSNHQFSFTPIKSQIIPENTSVFHLIF